MRLAAALLAFAIAALPFRAAAAERIVTASGAITEIVFALGAGDSVVAVDTTSLYPPPVQALPKIGYMRALAAEGILALRPTRILASTDAGPPRVIEQLRAAGQPITLIEDNHDFDGIGTKIRKIAAAVGREQAGEALAREVTDVAARVAAAVATVPTRPRIMFVLSASRGAPMAAGADTAADAVIRLAGGVNVMTGYTGYKPVSVEAATAANPDYIMTMGMTIEVLGGQEAFATLPQIAMTSAGRSGRLIVVDSARLLSFGPRTPHAVAELAQRLHPDQAARLQVP